MADYSTLTAQIIAYAENDLNEFVNALPYFIDNAQRRLIRDLDTYGFVQYVSVELSANNAFVPRPSGALIVKSFHIDVSGAQTPLNMRTDEYIKDYWPIRSSVGTPKYYGNWGFNQLIVAPTPVSNASGEMSIIVQPSVLSSAAPDNWTTEYAYNALFYAAMKEACAFMKDPQMTAQWEQMYQSELAALRNETRRTRRDDNEPNVNPAGGDNTLDGSD